MTAIVNFLSRESSSQLVGHVIFFLCNLFNVSYLIVFEGCLYRRLTKNKLSCLILCAACLQMISCANSIHRNNLGNFTDPITSHVGSAFGLASHTVLNICCAYLAFNVKKNWIIALSIFWPVLAIITFGANYVLLEEMPFIPFLAYIIVSEVFECCCIFVGRRHFRNGRINLDESILSNALMSRQLSIALFGHIIIFLGAFAPWPFVLYTASGLLFVNCNVLMVYVGRMDFMVDSKDEDAQAENSYTPSEVEPIQAV